ncbi:MAG: hypothetical protein WAN36_05750, partial [Calditrichia bacterium]
NNVSGSDGVAVKLLPKVNCASERLEAFLSSNLFIYKIDLCGGERVYVRFSIIHRLINPRQWLANGFQNRLERFQNFISLNLLL